MGRLDPRPKPAYVDVPMDYDTWERLREGTGWDHEKAIEKLHARAVEQLRASRPNWKEDEIHHVAQETMFRDSCRAAYYQALTEMQKRRRLPKTLRITFTRPGTRDDREREVGS
jgi:hypothetical protein